MIVAGAGLALVPPLLFRTIIDTAIPDGNRAQLVAWERWWSSRRRSPRGVAARALLGRPASARALTPASGPVRPRAAHAVAFFTRPRPARRQPPQQRRDRRPAGAHRHAGNCRPTITPLHAGGDDRPRLAHHLVAVVLLLLFLVPSKRVGRRLQSMTRDDAAQRRHERPDDRAVRVSEPSWSSCSRPRLRPTSSLPAVAVRTSASARRCTAVVRGDDGAGRRHRHRWRCTMGGLQVIDGNITIGTLVAPPLVTRPTR